MLQSTDNESRKLKTGMGDAALGVQQVSRGPWLGGSVFRQKAVTTMLAHMSSAPGLTPTGRLGSVMPVGCLPNTSDSGTKIK